VRKIGTSDDNTRPLNVDESSVFFEFENTEDQQDYTLTIKAMTDNEELENSEWQMAIVAARGITTNTNDSSAKKVLSFNFAIKNVCRDLPWKVPEAAEGAYTFNVYDEQVIAQENGLTLDLNDVDAWVDFCQISYTMNYNTGDLIDSGVYS
jgi:hypothetical protein